VITVLWACCLPPSCSFTRLQVDSACPPFSIRVSSWSCILGFTRNPLAFGASRGLPVTQSLGLPKMLEGFEFFQSSLTDCASSKISYATTTKRNRRS
jgi:hypothetical protein